MKYVLFFAFFFALGICVARVSSDPVPVGRGRVHPPTPAIEKEIEENTRAWMTSEVLKREVQQDTAATRRYLESIQPRRGSGE